MMQDAQNQHNIAFHRVEYAVPAMENAANTLAEFASCLARLRVASEEIERLHETARIGVGYIVAEFGRAVFVDIRQIRARRRGKPDISHAARGVRR